MYYRGNPEDVYQVLTSRISKSRYTSVTKPEGAHVAKIIFRTKQRSPLHDSIQELLNSHNELKNCYFLQVRTGDQSTLPVISIFHETMVNRSKHRETRILVKPQSGREWLSEGFWNERLESLNNWKDLKNTPDNQTEYEILKEFNRQIHELGYAKPVDLVIGSEEYKDIIGMIAGPTGHKSDFIGVNDKGKLVFFISHKDGFNATDYQQYSGISSRSGDSIYNHPEVQSFRKDISEKTPEDFYGKMYYREIKDINLKRRAIFGKYYDDGPSDLSSNNITHFAQGSLRLILNKALGKTSRARVRMDFATMLVTRDDIDRFYNEYEPYLGARQGEVYRTIEYETDDGGSKVNGVRGGVFAKGYIDNRTSELI